ncbi:MAG: PH domain-containing protein, partial [Candidatus Dormibacteria bacterium]
MVVLAVPFLSQGSSTKSQSLVDTALVGLAVVAGAAEWLVTRWRIEAGVLRIDTGLLRRRTTKLPLTRVQSIDLVRPGTARLLGLAEVRVRSGGSREGDVRLAYLAAERAEHLRDGLLALVRGGQPSSTVSDSPIARASTSRLLISTPLRGAILWPVLAAVTLLVLGRHLTHDGGMVAVATLILIAVGTAAARIVSSQYGFEVARTQDGLLIRGGAVGTFTETLALHRIQALRVVEPLLWRPFGWAKLVADVAGGQRRRDEDRSASGRIRTLVPVATRSEVLRVAESIVGPAAREVGTAPPATARLKAPLSYPLLRAGLLDGYAVSVVGRVRRLTTIIPLAKVQSVRWVQGPIQRRLGLATIHLDAAGGRSTGAALRDRSAEEARGFLARLPALCAAARRPTSSRSRKYSATRDPVESATAVACSRAALHPKRCAAS